MQAYNPNMRLFQGFPVNCSDFGEEGVAPLSNNTNLHLLTFPKIILTLLSLSTIGKFSPFSVYPRRLFDPSAFKIIIFLPVLHFRCQQRLKIILLRQLLLQLLLLLLPMESNSSLTMLGKQI